MALIGIQKLKKRNQIILINKNVFNNPTFNLAFNGDGTTLPLFSINVLTLHQFAILEQTKTSDLSTAESNWLDILKKIQLINFRNFRLIIVNLNYLTAIKKALEVLKKNQFPSKKTFCEHFKKLLIFPLKI